jgi:hypothetical protein
MTKEELEKKSGDWTKRIEDVVVEMASVTTPDGLLVYFTHEKIVESFLESLDALIHNHASGSYFVTGPIHEGDEAGEIAEQERER